MPRPDISLLQDRIGAMGPLKILVTELRFLLLQYHFVITLGKAFGRDTGVVVLENSVCKIKIVSEKGQVYTEMGWLDKDAWCELSIIRHFLDTNAAVESMTVGDQIFFLKEHFPAILTVFMNAVKENRDKLEELKYRIAHKA